MEREDPDQTVWRHRPIYVFFSRAYARAWVLELWLICSFKTSLTRTTDRYCPFPIWISLLLYFVCFSQVLQPISFKNHNYLFFLPHFPSDVVIWIFICSSQQNVTLIQQAHDVMMKSNWSVWRHLLVGSLSYLFEIFKCDTGWLSLTISYIKPRQAGG